MNESNITEALISRMDWGWIEKTCLAIGIISFDSQEENAKTAINIALENPPLFFAECGPMRAIKYSNNKIELLFVISDTDILDID